MRLMQFPCYYFSYGAPNAGLFYSLTKAKTDSHISAIELFFNIYPY